MDLVDADAEEEDEGHREAQEKELNGNGKGQQNHLRNEDDEGAELDGKGGAGDEAALNGEISMLRGKNVSLLQSQ